MIDFDLNETLAAVLAEGQTDAGTRGVALTARVDPALPRRLRGDESRLRRVLRLLVAHAVDASEQGTVHLEVKLARQGESDVHVRFEVSDEARTLLTDDEPAPETGEGDVDLALWHQLAQLLADELGVTCVPGQGTTFWFTVCLQTAQAAGRRVLVVEDNRVNQRIARAHIQKLGYAVDVVSDGQKAVEAVTRRDYGLILMDCQMPVMDGYDATAEIRRREGSRRHTPIVAFTAQVLAGNRERCLEIGMDDFVKKPATSDELQRVLEKWCPAS